MRERKARFLLKIGSGLLAALCGVGWGQPARADVGTYSGAPRQIRAGVLVTSAQARTVQVYNNPSARVTVPDNIAPYIFYVLDGRTDMKPAGWQFVNPAAPNTVTGTMYDEWANRNTSGGDTSLGGSVFRVGAPVSKNMGAYWEVNLDTSTPLSLQQYDILYLGLDGDYTTFTPSEREKLRHYIDGGGTVWLECENPKNGGNSLLNAGDFVVPVQFTGSGGGIPVLATAYNPLVTYPYSISAVEAASLGQSAANGASWSTQANPGGGMVATSIMWPVLNLGGAGSVLVSAGTIGAGHLIISSNDIAEDINNLVGGMNDGQGANTGAVSGTILTNVPVTDLKFAYNAIAWLTTVPTAGGSSRRTGSSQEVLGGRLETKWASVPPAVASGGSSNSGIGSGAVVDQGIAFYVDGANVLHAYNLNPNRVLNTNGSPDAGILDFALGTPYDEIWNTKLPTSGRVSTPTVYTVTNGNLAETVVTVTDSTGTTFAYNALPYNGGALQTGGQQLWSLSGGGDESATLLANYIAPLGGSLAIPGPSPAFSEGVLFALTYNSTSSDSARPWRVAPLDPLSGIDVFGTAVSSPGIAPPPNSQIPGMGPVMGSLAVGYVTDSSSGAIDKLVYAPTRATTGATQTPDSVVGLWFSTKGEPLTQVDSSANNHTVFQSSVVERRGVPWFAPPGNITAQAPPAGPEGLTLPAVHIVRGPASPVAGRVDNLSYINGDFTLTYSNTNPSGATLGGGPAGIRSMWIQVNNNKGHAILDGDLVYADFTVDWPDEQIGSDSTSSPTFTELTYVFNNRTASVFTAQTGTTSPTPRVIGAPALVPGVSGSDNLIFSANMELGQGQSFSATQEVASKIYSVQDQFASNADVNANNPNAQSYGVVSWMWQPYDIQVANLSQPQRLTNTDSFAPNKPGQGTPTSVIAFQAVGSPAIANGVAYILGRALLGTAANANNAKQVTVLLALPQNPSTSFTLPAALATQLAAAAASSTNGSVGVMLQQYDLSNPQISQPSITLQGSVNGTSAASRATNLVVDVGTGTVTVTNFHTAAGDFNMALPFTVSISGAVGGGGTGPNWLYNPAGYGPLDPLQWFMVIPPAITDPATGYTLNTFGLPTSGPSVIGNTLQYAAADGTIISVDLPNGSGGGQQYLYNGSTLRVHSVAALTNASGGTLAQANIISPPIGTAGTLVAGTPQGIGAFDNEATLIADGSRLIMVDAADNALLTIDATRSNTVAGGVLGQNGVIATTKAQLQHPSVAHRASLSDFLIADTGNNRVVQCDIGGVVEWEISKLNNDMSFLRPGDPGSLSQPTDVQTFTTSGSSLTLLNRDSGVTYTYNGAYTAYHYLIADSGNFRAVEVMDAYAPNGQLITMAGSNGSSAVLYHQVTFVTRTLSEQNLKLNYRTVQEFFDPNTTTSGLQEYLIAAVDNVRPAPLDPTAQAIGLNGTGVLGPGGSLVVFQRDFSTTNAQQSVDGDMKYIVSSIAIPQTPGNVNSPIIGHQAISNPSWFKEFQVPATNPTTGALIGSAARYLMADDNGVYVLAPTQAQENGVSVTEAVVEWELSANDYYYMTGRRLQAASVTRLTRADYDAASNKFYPHYLITNHYRGQDNVPAIFLPAALSSSLGTSAQGTIGGEVFEIRSIDYIRGGYQNQAEQLYFWDSTFGTGGALRSNWRYINNTTLNVPPIVWIAPQDPALVSIGNVIASFQNGVFVGLPMSRTFGTTSGTVTGPLEQPTFADRPF